MMRLYNEPEWYQLFNDLVDLIIFELHVDMVV